MNALATPPTIRQIAIAYGITENLIHQYKTRGITRTDYNDPATVAEKLLATAKTASPVLLRLCDKTNQRKISQALAAL